MPPNATPAAQADAFAALLDALNIDQINVIGLSESGWHLERERTGRTSCFRHSS
jgi:hypothetical protein